MIESTMPQIEPKIENKNGVGGLKPSELHCCCPKCAGLEGLSKKCTHDRNNENISVRTKLDAQNSDRLHLAALAVTLCYISLI